MSHEMTFDIEKITVQARTRVLKAEWTIKRTNLNKIFQEVRWGKMKKAFLPDKE